MLFIIIRWNDFLLNLCFSYIHKNMNLNKYLLLNIKDMISKV